MNHSAVQSTTPEEREAIRNGCFIAHKLPPRLTSRGEMIYLAKEVLVGKLVSLTNVTWNHMWEGHGSMQVTGVLPIGIEHEVRRKKDNCPAYFALVGTCTGVSCIAYVYRDSEILLTQT